MLNFTYQNPTKIIFGKDQINALNEELKPYKNENILLVYGKQSIKKLGVYDTILSIAQSLNINVYEESHVRPNPELKSVLSGRKTCIENNIKFILAAGGGSVIDCAKAIAFSATIKKEEDVWPIFLNQNQATSAIPLGVILTLAATGTESNGNAVITNDDTNEKRIAGYIFTYPKFAIIDPTYTISVNEHYTIAGVIDIMMHILEQYFSPTERTETADYMSLGILKSVIENTAHLKQNPNDYDTRANISWAATVGLNWILQQGKVGDWATHRLSYPITQYFGTTHGYALTSLFPAWLTLAYKYNKPTMTWRLKRLGKELFNTEEPEDVIAEIRNYFKSLNAPTSLKEANISLDEDTLNKMLEHAMKLGNLGNVFTIDTERAKELYQLAQ